MNRRRGGLGFSGHPRQGALGDTWRVYAGSRAGIQIARVGGKGVDPAKIRTSWTSAPDERRSNLGERVWGALSDAVRHAVRVETSSDGTSTVVASGMPGGEKYSGYYTEGGYIYQYTAPTKAIRIVLSPSSLEQRVVAKGTRAYDAIFNVIKKGKAVRVDATWLKSQKERLRSQKVEKANPRSSGGGAAPEVGPETPPAQSEGFDVGAALMKWGPWAAGGLLLIVGAVVLLKPPKRAAPAISGGA